MKRMRVIAIFSLGALVAGASQAALADDAGWYGGVNAGQSRATIDDPRVSGGLLGGGFATTSIHNDDHHFGWKAFGGYEFNRYFSLEAGYFDLGKFGFIANTLPLGTLHGVSKIKGVNFDALAMLPIGDRFSAFGRFGVNYADVKDDFAGTGAVAVIDPYRHKRAAHYKFGFGMQYDFTASVGMRIEAERYRIDDAIGNRGDVDLYSAGLVYRFGRTVPVPQPAPEVREPTPAAAPEPAPVAAPPPPPPAPMPPAREKVSFSADSLFAFNKDTVKPAGKQALDEFAAKLKGSRFEEIVVTGYTDRLGSKAYNLRLSQRRADAVKAYLVETAGIPADKITTRGADGSDPVTTPGECKGTRRTAKLIACLQPDRRVEVEVDGTKPGDTTNP